MKKLILGLIIILGLFLVKPIYASGYGPYIYKSTSSNAKLYTVNKWMPQEPDLGWDICKPPEDYICGLGTVRGTRKRILICSEVQIWSEEKEIDDCELGKKNIEQEYCNSYYNRCPCPINGGWTDWSVCASHNYYTFSFSMINNLPIKGEQFRSCSNPIPMFGGIECSDSGKRIEWQECTVSFQSIRPIYIPPITIINTTPQDGGWIEEWSKCFPASYDVTTKKFAGHQYKICANPIPMFEGQECTKTDGNKTSPRDRFEWRPCDY